MKSCSKIISEMQTTMRYHLTPVRIVIIKTVKNKYWWGCGKKGNLYTASGNVNWYSHCGKQYGAFSKTKNGTTNWSSNSAPEYIFEENENTNLKRYIHPVFIAVLSTIAKTWKQSQCPSTDEWTKKKWYICNGILLSHKKEWNFVICNNKYI